MTKTTYYIDTVVLSYYAGSSHRAGVNDVVEDARQFIATARKRGRIIGSSLLKREAGEGNPRGIRERQNALRLVRLYPENAAILELAAKYAGLFKERTLYDEDLRHYAAATVLKAAFFVTEDHFFKDDRNVLRLREYNKRHRLATPAIVSCAVGIIALSEHVRNPGDLFVEATKPRLSRRARVLYDEIMRARKARRELRARALHPTPPNSIRRSARAIAGSRQSAVLARSG